jgi:hypothetical protein
VGQGYNPIINGRGSRASNVLHELLEMYQETECGLPYSQNSVPPDKRTNNKGAHQMAIDIQKRIPENDERRNVNIE